MADILMSKNPLHSSKPIYGHKSIEDTSSGECNGEDLLNMVFMCRVTVGADRCTAQATGGLRRHG